MLLKISAYLACISLLTVTYTVDAQTPFLSR